MTENVPILSIGAEDAYIVHFSYFVGLAVDSRTQDVQELFTQERAVDQRKPMDPSVQAPVNGSYDLLSASSNFFFKPSLLSV